MKKKREINTKKNGRSITCISLTSSLYWDSTKLTCPLKAQQTPVSVITGVKISEQFTLKKARSLIGLLEEFQS